MNVYKRIRENLENRVHGVNVYTALAGVDFREGLSALKEMVERNQVEAIKNSLPREVRGPSYITTYRLNPTARLQLIVDNSKELDS